jgi:hypothetical protein
MKTMSKLSYDEWKVAARIQGPTPEIVDHLREVHDIDAHAEVERIVRELYQQYLDADYEQGK